MDTAQSRTSISHSAPKGARARATYASFGDDGTTATANAHGHLLQITRYFGNKPSGFFCVDLPLAPSPSFVEGRMDYLQKSCHNATHGIRLFFDDVGSANSAKWIAVDSVPKMTFVQDRWPSFATQTSAFYLKIQYVVSQGTVYQMYTFTLKEKELLAIPQIPVLMIDANVLLRNLNFFQEDDENERESNDKHYKYDILKDGYSMATTHQVQSIGQEDKDAVALFTSLFINGRLQTFEPQDVLEDLYDAEESSEGSKNTQGPKYYRATLDEQALIDLKDQGCLKITVAYKVDIISAATIMDRPSACSRADHLTAELTLKAAFKRMLFSEDEHLNFILRRNLEHILSVCSIPVQGSMDNDGFLAPTNSSYCKAIALTCGDVSGHRIATAASFYAFQFLLAALKYFQQIGLKCDCPLGINSCEDYVCKMYSRIRLTCQGHLKWLYYAHLIADNSSTNLSYWVTGETIPVCEGDFDEISITNTLFTFIKAASFCKLIADENITREVAEQYGYMATCLINSLHQNNKNNEYIFPRFKDQTPHTFHTSDHAIIWWAIKSAEELGLASSFYIPPTTGQPKMSYSSRKIQKSMLMKFTAENPDAKRSMLATSRNLSEDKFLLGANETILFHAMNIGLFDKLRSIEDASNIWKNKIDAWKNIVDWQEDLDTALSDPRQIALLYILSATNICVDSRPAGEIHDLTKLELFAICSSNGLFPGQLDENQEPILFDNQSSRDSYWHATFEVPYILWNYQQKRPISEYQLAVKHVADQGLSELVGGMETIVGRIDAMTASPTTTLLKRSVNEIPNEWLYDEPSFLKFHCDVSSDNIVQFCEVNKNNRYGTVIDRALRSVQDQNRYDAFKDDIAGYILDVPRNKGVYTKTRTFHLQEIAKSENFGPCITEKRTPAISKKRFFHFHPLNRNVALASFLASSERDAIASFFDRHASYDRYFSETTTLAFNRWLTELHLPFYQISNQEPSSGKYHAIAKTVGIPFLPNSGREESTMWINRATMSFRFDGDIFDRYWTCHFIEFNPRIISETQMGRYKGEQNPRSVLTRNIDGKIKENSWRQRKVLELVLFDLMLEEILKSTREILGEARLRIERRFRPETLRTFNHKDSILDPLDLIDRVDNNIFLSTNSLWNELEPIFQLIKDALHESLETIANWTDREKDRGCDQPQWTLNDERSYGRAISALQTSNEQKIHELKRYDAEVASFNALFARRLEVMRSELDRRGADDIRLFTYVTVVFLPVGFATSVFSMSGAPSGDMLHGMIILAILALFITFVALVNARILDRVLGPVFGACRVVTEAIVNPLVGELYRFIQPIGRLVHLLLCRSVYDVTFPLYMRFSSPDSIEKDNQNPDIYDQDTEKDGRDTENLGPKPGKLNQYLYTKYSKNQKHYKQITELGPLRTARRDIMNIQFAKRAKEKQHIKDLERQIKQESGKEYQKEEEEKFKENGQAELNAEISKEMAHNLANELKDAIKTEIEVLKKEIGELSREEKEELEARLKKDLEPRIRERLVKEGKGRIRKRANDIIEKRMKERIEKEARERFEKIRKDDEEARKHDEKEKKKQARETEKQQRGIFHHIFRKTSQRIREKSAGGDLESRFQG